MLIKELARKGFWTLSARIFGAMGVLFMIILYARILGVSDFGLFSLGMVVLNILGVIARWGTDQVILKKVGIHWEENPGVSKGYVFGALKVVLIVSAISSILLFWNHYWVANSLFRKPELSLVLFYLSFFITPLSVSYTVAESIKAIGRPVLSTFLQNLITPFVAILLGISLWLVDEGNLVSLIMAYGVGVITSLMLGVVAWKREFDSFKSVIVPIKRIMIEGWPMLLITSGSLLMAWTDILVLGALSTKDGLGVYSAASRVVMVTSLLLVAINSITSPKYAKLYSSGDISGLLELAQASSKLLFILSFLPTSFLLLFPEWVLKWFGDGFEAGSGVLVILAVGQFVNVSFGSVGYLLIMTGNELKMRKIILYTSFINIILSLLFFGIFDVLGVALSTMLCTVLWNIWALKVLQKELNFTFLKLWR